MVECNRKSVKSTKLLSRLEPKNLEVKVYVHDRDDITLKGEFTNFDQMSSWRIVSGALALFGPIYSFDRVG